MRWASGGRDGRGVDDAVAAWSYRVLGGAMRTLES
jgi:hypothetical protein